MIGTAYPDVSDTRSTIRPLRILMAHCRYQLRGGEDESCDTEIRLLRQFGHDVEFYEMDNREIAHLGKLNVVARTIWSSKSYRDVQEKLQRRQFDLVHVQNSFPLISPSIYYAAQKASVPVVQTLRNYRLICPGSLLFRDGAACHDCVGKSLAWPGIVHKCYRQSHSASATVAAMATIHSMLGTWHQKVNRFITLTQFARDQFVAGGLPGDRIVTKPNCVYPDPGPGDGSGTFALYVGRLSKEKGIATLLQAWSRLQDRIPLKIVGDGPLSNDVRSFASTDPRVQWLGALSASQTLDIIGQAGLLIFPSEWYETFGRVAIEAFAKGTPVIASRIGAIAEVVPDGSFGRLFEPGNASDLHAKLQALLRQPSASSLRWSARQYYKENFTGERNYEQLMDVYAGVLPSQDQLQASLLASGVAH
jgi:glycosyltransferase involved in cell wall biosynthesis